MNDDNVIHQLELTWRPSHDLDRVNLLSAAGSKKAFFSLNGLVYSMYLRLRRG